MKSRAKIVITSIVAFAALFAVLLAAVNAVFTVTIVKADFSVYSAEGEAESLGLQERLNKFVGKSSIFLDLGDLEETVRTFNAETGACFRTEKTEKRYPSVVKISVSERKEAFAFLLPSGGWATYDEEGVFLYEKATSEARSGGENIKLYNFSVTPNGEQPATGRYFGELLGVFGALRAALLEPRANILSVEFIPEGASSSTELDTFLIEMREGVVIRLYNPARLPAEKAAAAAARYLALSDREKMRGELTVYDYADSEEIDVQYSPDVFRR